MRVLATVLAWIFFLAFMGSLAITAAVSKDWSESDPVLSAWFNSLRQPDQLNISCCGSSDAYYADEYEVRDGKVFATITDSRGNPIPAGTVVEIPPHKVNRDPNISGHTVLFLSPNQHVYCWIPSAGV